MATIQSAVITTDTEISTKVESTHEGKKYGHMWIGEPHVGVAILSNDSAGLRRLAANVTALADNLDRATS